MPKGTVFLSDLHLGDVLWNDERYSMFNDFLDNFVSKYANQVIIAGDMLEWIQYREESISHCMKSFNKLLTLPQNGITVYAIVGNHDIDFCILCDLKIPIKLVYPKLHLDIEGLSFHIEHGHYHDPMIKSNPVAAKFFAAHGGKFLDALPPEVEHRLGAFKTALLSIFTTGKKRNVDEEELCIYSNAAAELAVAKSGAHDYVVFGHTHKAEIKVLNVPGVSLENAIYVNTGDWQIHTDFGFFVNGKMKLYSWETQKDESIAYAESQLKEVAPAKE